MELKLQITTHLQYLHNTHTSSHPPFVNVNQTTICYHITVNEILPL